MKIITRARGIPAYSTKKGMMRIEPLKEEQRLWLKLDTGKDQYIVELDKFELAIVMAEAFSNREVRETCIRDGLIRREELKEFHEEAMQKIYGGRDDDES